MLTSMRSRTASAGNGLITSRNSPGVQSPKISERFRIRKIRGRVQGGSAERSGKCYPYRKRKAKSSNAEGAMVTRNFWPIDASKSQMAPLRSKLDLGYTSPIGSSIEQLETAPCLPL